MAACIDKSKLKQEGETYFENNKELAVDIITVLDSLKICLQYELKVNLHMRADVFTPLNESENNEREEEQEKDDELPAKNSAQQ